MEKRQNIYITIFKLILSFFYSIYFWLMLLLGIKKKTDKKPLFFKDLDFIFAKWPKFFWNRPTGLKLWRMIWDFIHQIFFKKK